MHPFGLEHLDYFTKCVQPTLGDLNINVNLTLSKVRDVNNLKELTCIMDITC